MVGLEAVGLGRAERRGWLKSQRRQDYQAKGWGRMGRGDKGLSSQLLEGLRQENCKFQVRL